MSILEKTNNLLVPSGVKVGKLYSVIPDDGSGDFTFARASVASRINGSGLIENMGIDVPRLDYKDRSCPVLLTEPGGSNLITFPVSFDNAYWSPVGVSVLGGQASPHADYPTDAFKLQQDVSTGNHYLQSTAISFTSGNTYTTTVYIKPVSNKYIRIQSTNIVNYAASVVFDLDNLIVEEETTGTGKIEVDPVNGFYRLSIIGDSGATAIASIRVRLLDDAKQASFEGDGISNIDIFGAQLEQLAYPTSFMYDGIENTSTIRAQDFCSGAAFNGDSQSGVLYLNIAALFDDGVNRIISISDGTTNNYVLLRYDAVANLMQAGLKMGGGVAATIAYTFADGKQLNKIAVRFAQDDITLWADGGKQGTDITAWDTFPSPTTLTQMQFSRGSADALYMFARTAEMMTLDYLSDDEMIKLIS